jgi:20S proteasome subunit beta 6
VLVSGQLAPQASRGAQLLSNTLYYKRFFPYYTFNICAGLDAEGKGCVYTYDAIGSYERTNYSCQGSGQALIMPVLDNQLKTASPLLHPPQSSATPLSEAEAVDLVKDCFATAGTSLPARHRARRCWLTRRRAGERDIYTGDAVRICVINAAGIRWETLALKLD